MPKKNKMGRYHTPYHKLDKRDKDFITRYFYHVLHIPQFRDKPIRAVWKQGHISILDHAPKLPSGKIICRHSYDKGLALYWKSPSCALPTYDWAKDRRIQHSLINVQEYLYNWKDHSFSMGFIAPSNFPEGIDAPAKIEAIRDIKAHLTLIRKVWKELLVYGRAMSIRDAIWVSILGQGFRDMDNEDSINEIVSSALHYSMEESAFEISKHKTFETADFDAEHMLFSQAEGNEYNRPDKINTEVQHDLATSLGIAPVRSSSSYTSKYSKELTYEFRKQTFRFKLYDTALVLGIGLVRSEDLLSPEDLGNMFHSESRYLFILGIRKIVKDYDEGIVLLDAIGLKVQGLFNNLMKDPTPARDLATMGIVDADLPATRVDQYVQDDALDEAKIYKYSHRLIDQMRQTYEIEEMMNKQEE